MKITISAVGAVYHKCKPEWLEESLFSLINQSVNLDEIILVIDGPINSKLELSISKFSKKITVFKKKENEGLAKALNYGISKSSCGYILRYDTDDINSLDRVKVQIDILKKNPKLDILGSWVKEFGQSNLIRKLPIYNDEIYSYLKFRVAMNHPTVIYKKKVWQEIGGYPTNVFPEDYVFWLKAKKHNFIFENTPKCLVYMRTDVDFLERRRGYKYFKEELKYLLFCKKHKLLNTYDVIAQIFFKSIWRLLPIFIFKKIFYVLRKIF